MKKAVLTKADILRGLSILNDEAKRNGMIVDMSIYGGAALILAFDMRRATRDVDVAVAGNTAWVRQAAARIAEMQEWPESWLNDGVKGFLSAHEDMRVLDDFAPDSHSGGLRIYTPSPEYLFAMKCMAMRPEGMDGSHDLSDIEFLVKEANIPDVESALNLIEAFYPASQIPAKVIFGVEEMMERIQKQLGNDQCGMKP